VRVLPEGPVDKTFDYLVPETLGDQVRVGTMVRVELHGRRVGAWVVEDGVEPPEGVVLRPLAKVTGWGPGPELIDLAGWAAWRWAGRRATLLGTASPDRAVPVLPPAVRSGTPVPLAVDELARTAGAAPLPGCVLRLPPTADPYAVVLAAVAHGPTLIVAPSVRQARHLAPRLRRAGVPVAVVPQDWAQARAGGVSVIGARAAAWAPITPLAAVVVLDEHDEVHQEERVPTWHARDVAIERARRAGVPCILVSPCPSLEALTWGPTVAPPRSVERDGWPAVEVADRRQDDIARTGLFSPSFVAAARRARDRGGAVVCVLNRTGRSRLLACRACGELARCEACDSAVAQDDDGALRCHRCDAVRPLVCAACGSTTLRNLRMGVTRAREELEVLLGAPVAELTGTSSSPPGPPDAAIVVGTEAVLHQVDRAALVAFLDFDQELLAPRYRAAEEALALLVLAGRLVGGRRGGGRVLLQTRLPRHEVIQAALLGNPERLAEAERPRRETLGWPPYRAMAEISGAAAALFVERLGRPLGVEVRGPLDGRWLVRAADPAVLADALAAVDRPPSSAGRLRIAVDPPRV
jgi:primosomal protein N' (replication factor Y)